MESVRSLVERMKTEQRPDFNPAPRYYRQGDYVTYFVSPNRCFAHRVDSLFTYYTDVENGALVGCKVKGVRRLMSTLKSLAVIVSDGEKTLGLLFLSLLAFLPEDKKEEVLSVARKFASAPVNYDDIINAAA